MIPTASSTAWNAMPAASPLLNEEPCAWRAVAIAAEVTPRLPGVIGTMLATSSARTMTTAAPIGCSIPRAAATAGAAIRRAGGSAGGGGDRGAGRRERAPADEASACPPVGAERAEGVEEMCGDFAGED